MLIGSLKRRRLALRCLAHNIYFAFEEYHFLGYDAV
jgi:hypothetical protein